MLARRGVRLLDRIAVQDEGFVARRRAGTLPEPDDRYLIFWFGMFHAQQEISWIEGG
jgi:hypothetical protein